MPTSWPVHGRITGPIVMIGFGSIGRGTLPLIERHFNSTSSRIVVIDPEADGPQACSTSAASASSRRRVTRENYSELLTPLLTAGGGQGFCVNLSVDTSSLDIMELCRELGALYIDTVVEPWLGFYFDKSAGPPSAHQLRAARDAARGQAQATRAAPTAVSCCGANPGMVSWFVKQALLNLASDIEPRRSRSRRRREDWARLAQKARRQGHPHRRARHPARQESEAA